MPFPFQLSESLYNKLKWFVVIVLPAFGTFYVTLGDSIGLPNPNGVAAVVLALTTFLGAILGISTRNYNQHYVAHGDIVVSEQEDGTLKLSQQLERTPEELAKLDRVDFRVVREG